MSLRDVPYEEQLEAERRLKTLGLSRPEVSTFVLYGVGVPGLAAAVFEGLAGEGMLQENIIVILLLCVVGALIGRSVGREKVASYEQALEKTVKDLRRDSRSI
ncbi:hypothetical protein [Pseudophaeobacter sp. EL27]|uniref:hypothetical protein n=1 Tax=Pseudophaeobacter sp. EL27 TaxID=2107580 RepID=UPI0013C4B89D|nr:hypothetical protein [Pseudophaeobacter sp. EL27]